MNTRTLVSCVGIFIVGAVVGRFVGGNSDPTSTPQPVPPVSSPPVSPVVPAVAQTTIPTRGCGPMSTEAAPTPEDAFASALAQADGEWKSAQLTAAFARLFAHAPAEALRDADRIPVDYRQQVVSAALAQVAARQPDRVLTYIEGVTVNYPIYLGAVLAVIAQTDARRAVDIAIQNSHRDPTGEVFSSVIPALIHSDLEMAASVVGAMTKPPVALIQQVASEYARNDPDRAYRWASEVAGRRGRASVIEAVDALSAGLAVSTPAVAMDFVGRTQDATIRNSLIRAISQQMGQEDLYSAWTWLSQYRTDASYSENARNLLHRWSNVKPEEVAELLASIDDREIQSAVADELSRAWQRRDPNAYRSWVSSLPPGNLLRYGLAPPQD